MGIEPAGGAGIATILLAEDDAGHARLVERNLRRAGLENPIVHVDNGQRALEFIDAHHGADPARGALMLLLDLNMPVMDGYEVLRRLKTESCDYRVPVIVLSTSQVPEDVQRCYALGCNIYLSKPVEFQAFGEAVRRLGMMISVMAAP